MYVVTEIFPRITEEDVAELPGHIVEIFNVHHIDLDNIEKFAKEYFQKKINGETVNFGQSEYVDEVDLVSTDDSSFVVNIVIRGD